MRNADMPAWPTLLKAGEVDKSEGGLTKREYFAGLALQGLLASWSVDSTQGPSPTSQGVRKLLTEDAVRHADSLLAELERTK